MRLIAVVLAGSLMSCGPSKADYEDRLAEVESTAKSQEQTINDLRGAIENIRAAADKAKNAAEDIESTAGRFDDENWRSVVSDIQTEAGSVTSEMQDLDQAISDAESLTAK